MGKFFTVEVKPEIAASKQKLGAFTDGDLMFDWTSFQVPSGASRLLGVCAVVRAGDGATADHALNLHFAKTIDYNAPESLGTIHATANGKRYYNNLIGTCLIEETDMYVDGALDHVAVGFSGGGNRFLGPGIVLQGEKDSGGYSGYDTLYVAGTTPDGDTNFASTVQIQSQTATNSSTVAVKTTSAENCFTKGDVLYDEDDQLLGTVSIVSSPTNIVLTSNCASVSAINKDVYNLNPIKLILSFER
tara:strand:- start:466 stop:1203 length:738 start_codon:yes stop_codon:yes gene_type:complete